MNINNPLLNRLFEKKSSRNKRPASIKEEVSHRDKILIPKLPSKGVPEILQTSIGDKNKIVFMKANTTKLPPLNQKQPSKQVGIISQKKISFRQRKVSWNTSNEIPMFPTQFSFHSGNQLQQRVQEQVRQYSRKQSRAKIKTMKSETASVRNEERNEEQLFDYLKILEKNELLKDEFCYMNRGQLPYSYEIVNYESINKNQFLTVSLRGVSIYKDGQSEFTTAAKLSREIEVYRKVKRIQFFEQYILLKTIKHWRYRSVRRKFDNQCRVIGKNLLSQNPIILKFYNFLYNLKEDFVECKFLDFRITQTGNLQTLKIELKKKQNYIHESLQHFDGTIKKMLKDAIQKNLQKFRKEERVTINSDGKEINEETFLPYDNKKRQMRYTQIAKLKQFQDSMYRLIKMTDLIRFTTKTQMVRNGLENFAFQLKTLHEKFLNRKQESFICWMNMRVRIIRNQGNNGAIINSTPTIFQVQQTLRNYLKEVLDKFFRDHFLLIESKNDYYCDIYEQYQQMPNKLDLKYYVESNKQFISIKLLCDERLSICINDIKVHLKKTEQVLLSIYNDSFLNEPITNYMKNERLRSYLVSQVQNRKILSNWESIIQFGLVNLDTTEVLIQTREKFEEKFRQISNAIPNEVAKRCEGLAERIKGIYNIFKENPENVQGYIQFIRIYQEEKARMSQLQSKIDEIFQLQEMIIKNGLRIGQNSKIHINQCTTYFRQLQKRYEEIDGNEEKDKKKFYKMVDDMVDPLDSKAQQLNKRINEDSLLSNSDSDINKCLQKISVFQNQFQRLRQKKEQLFYFQEELKLGHKDIPNYFKLESNIQWINKIWKGRYKYNEFLTYVSTKGYAEKTNLNLNDLKIFIRDIELATNQIQFAEVLQLFKQEAAKVLNVMQICKLLTTETLQDQHKNGIKQKLIFKNKMIKDYIFSIEGGRKIICNDLVKQTNINQIKHELEEIVHASMQQSIIRKNIQQIQQFWRKNRVVIVSEDLSKNGAEVLHFGVLENEKLQQRVGSYLMAFKSILGSKHSVGQLQEKVLQQVQICGYLKRLMQRWIQVQKQWIKLLPLMTNSPSIKHQSNVYFEFTSLDNSLRKHNRNINDLNSLKKIVEDYSQKRYLSLMDNLFRDLKQVNKIFNNFLEMKRNTYYRFFFLADQELISILENTKDAKSLAKFAGYCFNCQRILLDKQLISGFETTQQIFKLRKHTLKGEPDQMFRMVEENMKTSLRFSILSLIPKMKVGMNIEQQHQIASLQAVLVADKFLWTQMTQIYLNPSSYDSYQLYLRRPCQQLAKFLKKAQINQSYRHKISVRLVQALYLRQIGEQMIKSQTTKEDFKWKEQRKYNIQQEQIVITQFNRKFVYGLQYYPPSKITIPTENFKMLLSQSFQTNLFEKVLVLTGLEGDGKRNLMRASAIQYGCFYKEIICNKNISFQYLLRFVQGAVLAGAWLSLYEFQHLQSKVLVQLFNQIKKIVNKIKKNQLGDPSEMNMTQSGNIQQISGQTTPFIKVPVNPTFQSSQQNSIVRTSNGVMFCLITHGFYPQKVSVYQYDTFALTEPNHKKICQWLLQVNSFTSWQHLSKRLIVFLETVFPFLQKAMGSFMSILRKTIDAACLKKRNSSFLKKETDLIAEAFKEQIIDKSDQNIHQLLYEAIKTYFYYQPIDDNDRTIQKINNSPNGKKRYRKQSFTIETKLNVICSLLLKKVNNILVIGPRSNKSTLINQAGKLLNRKIFTFYPQSSDFFFHSQTVQKFNKLQESHIIHYDGESIIRQWNDLVTSGSLLMQGKKIQLHNQLIIELRTVNNCTPSFVGNCQIVYVGNYMNKKEKFLLYSQAVNCEAIVEPMTQIFGDELQNLPEYLLEGFGLFLKQYANDPRSKNYHKLIVWFASVLGIQNLWNKFYGGRYTDFTVNRFSHQLATIDESKYQPLLEKSIDENLKSNISIGTFLIQTKSTILINELTKNLLSISIPLIFTGKSDSGKSTLMKLILSNIKNTSKSQHPNSSPHKNSQISIQELSQVSTDISIINLTTKQRTYEWTRLIKYNLTNIRKDGKNYLMNVGNNDIIISIDDLDLGFQSHRQYVRQLIDLKTLNDSRFQQYEISRVKVLATWFSQNKQSIKVETKGQLSSRSSISYKLFDRLLQVQLPEFSKQSVTTIVRVNIQHFIKKNNMSKQVANVIESHLIKSLIICFDDLTNISGSNAAASIIFATMRNILSLPKKNALMGIESYVQYFILQLKSRMMQKVFTSKLIWQYNNVIQNLNKIIFQPLLNKSLEGSNKVIEQINNGDQTITSQESLWFFTQNQFKLTAKNKIMQKINSNFPNVYIFDQLLRVSVLLSNQLHLLDNNCILIGHTGTGKLTILKIVAFLSKMEICNDLQNLSDTIVKCLRGKNVILLESYKKRDFRRFLESREGTAYQKLLSCLHDEELQKLVTNEDLKKQFNSLILQIPNKEGIQNTKKALSKVMNKLKSVIVFDSLAKYNQASTRYRQLNRYFVSYVSQWPAQALLNISGIKISQSKLHLHSSSQKADQNGEDDKKSQYNILKLLAEVFASTNKIIQSFDQPSISIKKFNFFLVVFEKMWSTRNQELTQKIQFYTKIYSKFSDACHLVEEWERRIDFLKVELEESLKELDEQLKVNREQSSTFSMYHMLKQKQQMKIRQRNEQMGVIKKEMQKRLVGMKKIMQSISKIVNSMQRTQMSELKKIYKSSNIVNFGLQCLSMLLGEEPGEKSINKILADPNLMMKMKSPAILEKRNNRVVDKFKNEQGQIKQEYENRSKSEASRVLIDWIRSILQYWNVLAEHQSLVSSYENHKLEYQNSLRKHQQIEQQTKKLKEKILKLNKNYDIVIGKKEEQSLQYSKITLNIFNAKKLLPSLKKSEEQTWEVIKEVRQSHSCLIGDLVLSVACLVYLPLKRLRLKKLVLDQIKKLLNFRMVQFSEDFISMVCRQKDAVLEDLNLVVIKQIQDLPMLIVDPQRRAMPYLFEQDPKIAKIVKSNILSQSNTSTDMNQIIQNWEDEQKLDSDMEEQQQIVQKDENQNQQEKQNQKKKRNSPILHTTEQNYRPLVEKLPENTLIVDWKFTTINSDEKIFLKIAARKKPEYFQAKKDLNRKIKKDLIKIQELKRSIYQVICEKQIKVLEDTQFVELSVRLLELQVQTQENKVLQRNKIDEIKQYANQINEEVTKIIYMVNSLKKIKNIALDIILEIACVTNQTILNIIKWAVTTLEPKARLGWLISIALEFSKQNNEQLLTILVKDAPLKISELTKNKKPTTLSSKNYEMVCRLNGYTPNLRSLSQAILKNPKQFEVWTLDSWVEQIPNIFKAQTLSILEDLIIYKIFKKKFLLSRIKKHIQQTLKLSKIEGYSNKELLAKTSKKYPIIANCSIDQLQALCAQLNNSKIRYKSIVQISDVLQLKRYIWTQMTEGNWVVFHSVYDRNSRQMLEDILQYVVNYEQQASFRLFIYPDQIQLTGYQAFQQIKTKFNSISEQNLNNRKKQRSSSSELLLQSKYIQNIGINIYEEQPSFRKNLLQTLDLFHIDLPEVTIQTAQQNPLVSAFLGPQTPGVKTQVQRLNTPAFISSLVPSIISGSLNNINNISVAQKEKFYFQKIIMYFNLALVAAWVKFPKLRLSKMKKILIRLLQYLKQYRLPLQFNVNAISSYIGKTLSCSLSSHQRIDMQELIDRVLDQTKINDKQIFGIPMNRQSIALALAGIGRGGAQIDKAWIDEKVKNNYHLLGCQQPFLNHKNNEHVQKIFSILGEIKYYGRSPKQQIVQIRQALARLPTNSLVFSREVKNHLFLYCYMNQLKWHNRNIAAGKQFIQWVNVSSNQELKQDQIIQQNKQNSFSSTFQQFNWQNLLKKAELLTGFKVNKLKIRNLLTSWLHNLKRKHDFLLYWNLDSPVLVLHPSLLMNMPMIVSTYVINYLSANHTKIKLEYESTSQSIMYTLQLQFSRQTDQKQLYMTEGILLPDLIYKQFRYNFQVKMLDPLFQWNGEDVAPLIMLKMKKLPDPKQIWNEKDTENYQSPPLEVATRLNNLTEVVYRIQTFIDGNYQQWNLRRPMLISE